MDFADMMTWDNGKALIGALLIFVIFFFFYDIDHYILRLSGLRVFVLWLSPLIMLIYYMNSRADVTKSLTMFAGVVLMFDGITLTYTTFLSGYGLLSTVAGFLLIYYASKWKKDDI